MITAPSSKRPSSRSFYSSTKRFKTALERRYADAITVPPQTRIRSTSDTTESGGSSATSPPAGHDRTRPDTTGPDRTWPDRTGPGRAAVPQRVAGKRTPINQGKSRGNTPISTAAGRELRYRRGRGLMAAGAEPAALRAPVPVSRWARVFSGLTDPRCSGASWPRPRGCRR